MYSLPTKQNFFELLDSCQWNWNEKKIGYDVIGKNGNSIFLPALGFKYKNHNKIYDMDWYGYYWSSSEGSSSDGYRLIFLPGYHGINDVDKSGFYLSVRLVQASGFDTKMKGFVDLGLPSGTLWAKENASKKYLNWNEAMDFVKKLNKELSKDTNIKLDEAVNPVNDNIVDIEDKVRKIYSLIRRDAFYFAPGDGVYVDFDKTHGGNSAVIRSLGYDYDAGLVYADAVHDDRLGRAYPRLYLNEDGHLVGKDLIQELDGTVQVIDLDFPLSVTDIDKLIQRLETYVDFADMRIHSVQGIVAGLYESEGGVIVFDESDRPNVSQIIDEDGSLLKNEVTRIFLDENLQPMVELKHFHEKDVEFKFENKPFSLLKDSDVSNIYALVTSRRYAQQSRESAGNKRDIERKAPAVKM